MLIIGCFLSAYFGETPKQAKEKTPALIQSSGMGAQPLHRRV
jgi:hypothetical protein